MAHFHHRVTFNQMNTNLSLFNTYKRVSLITGRQLPHTPTTKRSKSYRRIQMNIYNCLERPSGFYGVTYQMVMYEFQFLKISS